MVTKWYVTAHYCALKYTLECYEHFSRGKVFRSSKKVGYHIQTRIQEGGQNAKNVRTPPLGKINSNDQKRPLKVNFEQISIHFPVLRLQTPLPPQKIPGYSPDHINTIALITVNYKNQYFLINCRKSKTFL